MIDKRTCENCRHWNSNKYDGWDKRNEMDDRKKRYFQYGECSGIEIVDEHKLEYIKPIFININGRSGLIETHKDFYCNLWVRKQEIKI